MKTEQSKGPVTRFYTEVLNGGNIELLGDIAAEDYVEHDPLPGQREGLVGLKDRVEMLRGAFDPRFSIEDTICEGDRVVVRWTNHGTHVAEFMGIPATGRSFVIAGIDVHRMRDGKIAEHWHVVDMLGMLQQLGLVPSPGQESGL